jgi:hypothetical protein
VGSSEVSVLWVLAMIAVIVTTVLPFGAYYFRFGAGSGS